VDETTLIPEFEEGTSLKEQLRTLLDRLETAQSSYPCKFCVTPKWPVLMLIWRHVLWILC